MTNESGRFLLRGLLDEYVSRCRDIPQDAGVLAEARELLAAPDATTVRAGIADSIDRAAERVPPVFPQESITIYRVMRSLAAKIRDGSENDDR